MTGSISRVVRRAVAAVFAMLAIAAAVAAPASAQTDDVRVLDAAQCQRAPGPGNWNDGCMWVYGYSVRVDRVKVYLEATSIPGYPVDVCNVKFDVWGKKAGSGVHWEQTVTNPNCGLGTLAAWFYPGEHFMNGSYFCSRTVHAAGAQTPNCITIKA